MNRGRAVFIAIVATLCLGGVLVAVQSAELTVSDGMPADELGGTPGGTAGGPNVDVDGNLAVVSASFAGPYAGKVYAFEQSGGTWMMRAELARPTDPGFSDTAQLGHSVGISGDRVIVGAPFPISTAGRAWVYRNAGAGDWEIEQELVAPDPAAGDEFGASVAISGDLAIVGARGDNRDREGGSAQVFRWDGAAWVFEARLKADDSVLGDDFGNTVAIDVDRAVVGAIFHPAGVSSGAAYVFERDGTWTQAAKLTASDGAALDQFSRSLDIEGDLIVVGAPQHQISFFNQGAAYLYQRDTTWSEQSVLTPSDASARAEFGYSVSISPNVIAVGARSDQGTGAVYLFQTTESGADEMLKQQADDATLGDRYGDSVAISGNTLLVSAPLTDDQAAEAGSAYFVTVTGLGEACIEDADCNDDDVCTSDSCGIYDECVFIPIDDCIPPDGGGGCGCTITGQGRPAVAGFILLLGLLLFRRVRLS